jgi:acyl carrier protein
MAKSEQEIFETMKEVLVDALGVDDDEVTMDATLVGDLGAESIDFLDIVFRLEKAFGIKIDQGEIFPESVLQDATLVVDGKITDGGIAELKKRLPSFDLSALDENRNVDEFANIFKVSDFVKFVQSKLK